MVARVAACSGRELDVAFAAARCGENNCNGHLLEFKNSLLAAETGFSLHRLNSLNSLIRHPSMHALSLEMCVENVGGWGLGGSVMVVMGFHVCWALRVWMGCVM